AAFLPVPFFFSAAASALAEALAAASVFFALVTRLVTAFFALPAVLLTAFSAFLAVFFADFTTLLARLVTALPNSFALAATVSAAVERVAVTPLPLLIVFPSSGLLRAGRPPAKCSANSGACMQRWQGGCGHRFPVADRGCLPDPSPVFAGREQGGIRTCRNTLPSGRRT